MVVVDIHLNHIIQACCVNTGFMASNLEKEYCTPQGKVLKGTAELTRIPAGNGTLIVQAAKCSKAGTEQSQHLDGAGVPFLIIWCRLVTCGCVTQLFQLEKRVMSGSHNVILYMQKLRWNIKTLRSRLSLMPAVLLRPAATPRPRLRPRTTPPTAALAAKWSTSSSPCR